jgi:DNA-binding XRE family transcriptional regulator
MAKSFKNLRNKMSQSARQTSKEKTAEMLHEMHLNDLRKMRQKTQEDLAQSLQVEQPYISKLERQSDMYISKLRDYLAAIGGELVITAKFPDGDVRINQFEELDG